MSKHVVIVSGPTRADPYTNSLCRLQESGAVLKCRHCGETFPMPIGNIPWSVAVGRAFDRAHGNCKPPAKGGAS